jgi:hypothetical protein
MDGLLKLRSPSRKTANSNGVTRCEVKFQYGKCINAANQTAKCTTCAEKQNANIPSITSCNTTGAEIYYIPKLQGKIARDHDVSR